MRRAIELCARVSLATLAIILCGPPSLIVWLMYGENEPENIVNPIAVFIMLEILWLLVLAAIEYRFM